MSQKDQRDLSSFPLPPAYRSRLSRAGFFTVADLAGIKSVELSKELDVTPEEALEILDIVRGQSTSSSQHDPTQPSSSEASGSSQGKKQTVLELLQQERELRSIITFSPELDALLGGLGIPLTKVTEFAGAPGVGKTQLGMQLCVDVQIPEALGGVGGEAVYIDTEGSFIAQRVRDIVRATIRHLKLTAHAHDNGEEAVRDMKEETFLKGIHYFRIHDYIEQIALSHTLADFCAQHPKVKLVVVDSIAFHFRHDFGDMALRSRLLSGMAQTFLKLATDFKLAVVFINQMTTKIGANGSMLTPALGETWGHSSTIRIILSWQNSMRCATMYKSPSMKEGSCYYQVTADGIRGLDQPADAGKPPAKKSREEY